MYSISLVQYAYHTVLPYYTVCIVIVPYAYILASSKNYAYVVHTTTLVVVVDACSTTSKGRNNSKLITQEQQGGCEEVKQCTTRVATLV